MSSEKRYVVRITRVRRVVEQTDVTITAGSLEEAEELAAEHDVNGWAAIDATTEHREERVLKEVGA